MKSNVSQSQRYDPETRPDTSNLVRLFAAVSGRDIEDIVADEALVGHGMHLFKTHLAGV